MPNAPIQDPICLDCPAKLNLTLAVGPPRADGLHPIASLMVALRFADTLTLKPLAAGLSRFTRRFADDAPRPQPIDWPVERDLAFRAHALIEAEAGRPLPIDCVLDKRIPAGAGLGGGSSNAAGVLIALRRLFQLSIDDDRLVAMGRSLGADVCFLLRAMLGEPAALVTGIGGVIEPADRLPGFDVVLVFPEGVCPTAAVYKAFDAALSTCDPTDPVASAAAWRGATAPPDPHNDLEAAAESVCPAIADARSALRALGLSPRLTGSGSALFVLAQDAADARRITGLAQKAGLPAAPTRYDDLVGAV